MRTLICLLLAEETVKGSKARKHVQVASRCRFRVVPIGALLVVLHRVCLSHVSGWLRLVEVFAVAPLGVSCFLSLWPVRTLGRRQVVASRHSATGARRVMRARLVFWMHMQLTRNQ